MTRKLTMLAVAVGIITLAFILRPSPHVSKVADPVAFLNAIYTDSVHVFGEVRFIGCPNVMHSPQGPWRVAVESRWSDSLEPLRNAMDPHSFQREHYAAINWHGNFDKQIE